MCTKIIYTVKEKEFLTLFKVFLENGNPITAKTHVTAAGFQWKWKDLWGYEEYFMKLEFQKLVCISHEDTLTCLVR